MFKFYQKLKEKRAQKRAEAFAEMKKDVFINKLKHGEPQDRRRTRPPFR